MSSRFCHPKDRSFPPGEFHENLCFQKSQMGSNKCIHEGRKDLVLKMFVSKYKSSQELLLYCHIFIIVIYIH